MFFLNFVFTNLLYLHYVFNCLYGKYLYLFIYVCIYVFIYLFAYVSWFIYSVASISDYIASYVRMIVEQEFGRNAFVF
jgi:hypothetical protein